MKMTESSDYHVSVIIPAYNSARFLAEAIESVLGQTYPVFEIIVVDDGSIDNTKEVCINYPMVQYIYHNNQGVAAARNTGIRVSKGEYLLFLDSDDRILPQAVEIGVNCLKTHPEVGFVFGRYEYKSINPDGSYTIENTYENQPEVANYATLLGCEHEIQCGCVIFRRIAIEAIAIESVGAFDPNLALMEDQNLFLRVAREFPIYFHDQIVSEYRVTGNNISNQAAKILIIALHTHSLQWSYIQQTGNEEYQAAYERGKQYWLKLCVERLPYEIMKCTQSGQWIEALGYLRLLLNYDPKLQYVDRDIYTVAAQNMLTKLRELPIADSLAYWKQQLAGAPPLLALPTDRPRPAEQNYQGTAKPIVIPSELTQALSLLSRDRGVSLFMTLLAAYNTLLYRYTRTEDIIVGSPFATYINSEIFVNAVALRTDMSGNPSFKQLLERVRKVTLLSQAYQDLPDCVLIDELSARPDPSYSPLFQVTLVFEEHIDLQKIDLSTLTASPWVLENNAVKYDLTLFLKESSGRLEGFWIYNNDLFDNDTIDRLNDHFQTLLQGIVDHPEQSVSELPLLTATEKQQLLVEWNNTRTDYPQDKFIHQLIADQAEQKPEATAVVFDREKLTYRALNHRANSLAHYLRSLGVGAEAIVGIFLEKSLDLIVTVLGILKSGAAYLPLDPSYPRDRLEFMLADANPPVIITTSLLKDSLPSHNAQVICLDLDRELLAQQSSTNPRNQTHRHSLTYIIYTSGSTGKPKGVMIEQNSLVNAYLAWESAYHLTTETSSHLQMASFSFDVFAGDFVRALCSGAKLVLCPRDLLLESKQLYALMRQEQVDCAEFVPAVLRNLVEYLERSNHNLGFMKLLAAGSDSWYLSEYQQIRSLCGLQTRLINSYGVSEATIDSTYFETDPVDLSCDRLIPIGRPFPNTQIYILDQYQQPVPIGVPGELHIGGAGLARGYLNRPDLTESKFVPNPFQASHAERLYKTGDLVRYLSDGNIEFVGRIDYQVKIRGFRVELGEIEALLSQHPEIREASVIVREDVPGDKRLIACIAANPDSTPTANELWDFLSQHLPNFMIPSAFVMLDDLPMTPNGKIDRRALLTSSAPNHLVFSATGSQTANRRTLPIANTAENNSDNSTDAPRTPTEEVLVGIWQQVLGLDRVSIHDNFFALGGHSLIAAKMIGYCYQAFAKELSLSELFASPTIAGLAEIITNDQHQNSGLSHYQIIPQRAHSESVIASFAQQRLWLLEQLDPGRADYLFSIASKLTGDLNFVALQQALDTLVIRHEVLRTNFINKDSQPIQVIRSPQQVELVVVDLQSYPQPQRDSEIDRQLQYHSLRTFDLERDLMLRGCVLQIGAQEQILLLMMHHIAADGWSLEILSTQLQELYAAACEDRPPKLPALPLQYADFAIWQRERLQGEFLDTALTYWQQQMAGAPALLSLPTDRPRPAVQTFRGRSHAFTLDQSLTAGLSQLSRQAGVTLFMTLLAAFDTLLYRYTGSADLVVGAPIANRNREEISGLIGFFVNTLALRTDLSGNPSFRELLERVKKMAIAAYNHQDLPFDVLVDKLQLRRDLSYSPVFQVIFAFEEDVEPQQMDLRNLITTPYPLGNQTAQFDLTLQLEKTADSLVGTWKYSTDLFDASTIERLAGNFHTLLKGIVANPEQSIQELPILTATERDQLLFAWNDTQTADAPDLCIHQIFERQVERAPEAIAVSYENQHLTYEQLNDQANQLAHYLIELGVTDNTFVGICVDRSIDTIVGILGILKAGGAYVPLDPNNPRDRLAYILADAQVQILVTQSTLIDDLPSCDRAICVDTDLAAITRQPQHNPDRHVRTDNLAYMIYTSGSTGQPKGVLVDNYNVVRLFTATEAWYQSSDRDVWTLFHSYAFDFSVWEIWGALFYGGRLVVVPYLVSRDPSAFHNLLAVEKVTVLNQTPSAFAQLMKVDESLSLSHKLNLRLVIFGGEALNLASLEPWFDRHGDTTPQLVNMYGITETTVHVTYCPLTIADVQSTGSTIGRPIPDLQIYLLDPQLQLVPIGVSGEMYVGGAGVTQGYWQRERLTQERFCPNLFADADTRLYKTGDLARYLPDGNLEYLGRIDNQVKIRGFRIELSEIETVLSQYPAVAQTSIIVREDRPGDQRLVAYCVAENDGRLTTSELRQFLSQQMPNYMVPAVFVILPELPMTPNGKVDRRALPAPDDLRSSGAADTFVAPRNEVERQLTQIWQRVLGIQSIGVTDNFFDLGGHSLLAVRLLSEIQTNLGHKLTLAVLFTAQTIEQLADICERADNKPTTATSWSSLVPIQTTGSKPPLFLIHAIWGNVLYYRELVSYLEPDRPFYGLQAQGLDGKQAPYTSVVDMAAHYIQAIQSVQPQGPYAICGSSFGGVVAFEIARQLHECGEQIALLGVFDTAAPTAISAAEDADLVELSNRLLFHLQTFLNLKLSNKFIYVWTRLKWHFTGGKASMFYRFYLRYINRSPSALRLLDVALANRQALQCYTPTAYPGPLTLFYVQPKYPEKGNLAADFGWSELARGKVEVYEMPGDHETIMHAPQVRVLAAQLTMCLQWAETATSSGTQGHKND